MNCRPCLRDNFVVLTRHLHLLLIYLNIFHSRFIKKDRAKLEEEIQSISGSTDDIKHKLEEEIAKHERNLESLREQAEYIEGEVNSNYIREQIVEEEYEIRRLRRMLGE